MIKTIADWITAARFLLAAVLFIFLWRMETEGLQAPRALECAWTAFVIFVVAAVTDLLDGAVARRTGLSDFGRVADPFVDKVLVVGALVFLVVIPQSRALIPTWSVVVIVAREFLVTGVRGFVESKGMAMPADAWGKTKMVLQCLGAGGGLLYLTIASGARFETQPMKLLFENVPLLTQAAWWLAVTVTIYSGAAYVVRAWSFISSKKSRP